MPPESRTRVLQDLSLAMLGYSGIPQDTRLMFKTFSRLPGIEVTGLLAEMGPGFTRKASTRKLKQKQQDVFNSSMFLLGVSGIETDRQGGRFARVKRLISGLREPFGSFGVAPIDFRSLDDAIWRLYFEKTLDAADKSAVLAQKFALTNLSFWAFQRRLQARMFSPLKLDTRGYDFLVTSEPRPLQLSPGTRHIARFHDAIPLTDADTCDNFDVVRTAFNMIYRSPPKSYYCCVSKPSEDVLLQIFPKLKGRTTTIPNALPELPDDVGGMPPVSEILRVRRSELAPVEKAEAKPDLPGIARMKPEASDMRYIMAVSTIEPRKNFVAIVRAWERVRYQHDPNLKLVIVGRPGWRFEPSLAAMRPRILEGNLIHLQDVPSMELRSLYAGAECLVFPSYAEGFGFPPLESLQCGTPVVVSDIATHRWSLGDAALYVDPYSVSDIADKIVQLVVAQDRETTRHRLLQRAQYQLSRYTPDAVGQQWNELFADLKRGGKPAAGRSNPDEAMKDARAAGASDLAAAE